MAVVYRLPVVIEGEAVRRLTDELTGVIQAGGDPGPRRHQIEVLRQSIRQSLRDLPAALASSAERLPAADPTRRMAEESVRRFMEKVEGLIAMVETDPETRSDTNGGRSGATQTEGQARFDARAS